MIGTDGPSIRVLAAVIVQAERFLICQRPGEKRHGGLWEFPGGKLEEGETLLGAAQRELFEELGVRVVEIGQTLYTVRDPGSRFVIEFVPTTIGGDPQRLEHTAIRWALLDDVRALPLAPSDRRFVEVLITNQNRQLIRPTQALGDMQSGGIKGAASAQSRRPNKGLRG